MVTKEKVNAYLQNVTISGNSDLDKQFKEELAREYYENISDLEHACLLLTTNLEHRQLIQAWTHVFVTKHATNDQKIQQATNQLVGTGMTPVGAAIFIASILNVKTKPEDIAAVEKVFTQNSPYGGTMSFYDALIAMQIALGVDSSHEIKTEANSSVEA